MQLYLTSPFAGSFVFPFAVPFALASALASATLPPPFCLFYRKSFVFFICFLVTHTRMHTDVDALPNDSYSSGQYAHNKDDSESDTMASSIVSGHEVSSVAYVRITTCSLGSAPSACV